MAFCSAGHVFVKTIDKAGVTFPATKAEIIEKLGTVEVQVSDDEFKLAADIVKEIEVEAFPNGASFLCAYTAAQFIPLKAEMESVKKFNS